jgi:EEF1A N-terminal glycine/lysine methyltransferase
LVYALLIVRHCTSFSRIITADCFWKSDAHCALVMSLDLLLQISPSARILVIAGLHTGRTVVCQFLKLAKTQGLVPDENGITEYDLLKGGTRPWEEDRGAEDTTEKKRWLIVTQLKRQ